MDDKGEEGKVTGRLEVEGFERNSTWGGGKIGFRFSIVKNAPLWENFDFSFQISKKYAITDVWHYWQTFPPPLLHATIISYCLRQSRSIFQSGAKTLVLSFVLSFLKGEAVKTSKKQNCIIADNNNRRMVKALVHYSAPKFFLMILF